MTQPANPGLFGQAVAEAEEKKRQYGQFTGYAPVPGAPAFDFTLASGGTRRMPDTPGARAAIQGIDAAGGGAPPGPQRFNPLVSTKGGGELGVREGGNPANPMDYVVRTPGRAATKGGMQARGMTSQGGYNVDEQFLEQMESSQIRSAAIQERGLQRGIEAAAERQGFMEAQKAQAEREMAVLAHENQIKQQRLGEYQAKFDKAEQDYTNFHAEKEREANSPKAQLASFLGTLSSALGALGAGLARTPNFAAEANDRRNEMQLRREEAELRVRKDNKDSLLGQLQQQMGSLDLAKSAYRAMQAKQSATGWEMLAQKEQNAEKQQQLLQVAELQNQNYLKWREEYVRGAEGEVTRTFQYVPGQSASRGGNRAPTIEELKGLQDLRVGEAGIGKTQADTAKSLAAADPNKAPHLGQRAQGQIVAARNARTAIAEYADALGVKRGEKGDYEDPSFGAAVAAKVPYSPVRQKVNALKLTLTAEVGKAQTGGVLTVEEAKHMNDQIASANTPGEIGSLLRHYDHTMASVEKNARNVAASSGRGSDEPDDGGGDRR